MRCRLCFQLNVAASGLCLACLNLHPPFAGVAAALSYEGPARALLRAFKYNKFVPLAKGLSAFMVAQFARLHWPYPDLVVPVPQSRLKRVIRGFNQSELLARHLALSLSVPHSRILKRRSKGPAQMGLDREERRNLPPGSFALKWRRQVEGATLLLIDDAATTGTTLLRAAEALQEGHPMAIYALTLCRTERVN